MAYGEIKIDTITFTAGGVDTSVSVSGLVQNPTFTGGITTTGTLQANTVIGTTLVSGSTASFTGTLTAESGVFASGVEASPSVSIGTPDNGLYSPNTDEVAISTNSSQRLLIDASGNVNIDSNTLYVDATNNRVGIGTSTPGTVLHCAINSSATSIAAAPGTAFFQNLNATSGAINNLLFVNSGGFGSAAIYTTQTQTGNSGDNLVLTTKTGGGTWNTGVVVDTSGRVGIGTTNPARILDVVSTQQVVGHFESSSSTLARIGFSDANTTDDTRVGIGAVANDLTLYAGATERARIDSSGRLLVGTSSTSGIGNLQVRRNSGGTATGVIELGTSDGYASIANGNTIGILRFTEATNSGVFAQIYSEADSTVGNNDYPGRLVFSTTADGASSPTERMRITQDGVVQSTNNTTNFRCINTGANGTALIYFQTNSAELGKIRINGAGVAYDTTSDYRLKENIEPITDAIARLQALKPWRFNFISHPEVTVDGFLAHEAQEVVPEAVGGNKDEVDADGNPIYQSIDQSKLVPLLTAALQEAISEIESLKARVAALETP